MDNPAVGVNERNQMDENNITELKEQVGDLEAKVLLAVAVGCTPRMQANELRNDAIEEEITKLIAPDKVKERAKVLLSEYRPRDPKKLA
jgi:hypothetical protein